MTLAACSARTISTFGSLGPSAGLFPSDVCASVSTTAGERVAQKYLFAGAGLEAATFVVDLKSLGWQRPCRFESGSGHQLINKLYANFLT